mgnify:CR=1 FL=1
MISSSPLLLTPPAVCVYCASSDQVAEDIFAAGRTLGTLLAQAGLDLVYGGTTCGLMLVTAKAHQAAGGRVIGVVPDFMVQKEIHNADLDEVVVATSMADRKSKMQERSGAFICLPGGFGTYDELFDTLAQRQLRLLPRPILLINIRGYYEPLLAMLKRGVAEKIIKPQHLDLLTLVDSPEAAMEFLRNPPLESDSPG